MTMDLVLDADDHDHRHLPAGADDTRFVFKRASSMEWVLIDTTIRRPDPARVIACVYEYEPGDYGVVCLGDLELRAEYGSLQEVIDDACRAAITAEEDRLNVVN